MVDTKKPRTVFNNGGVPVLEIVQQENTVTIFEAGDLDHQVRFPATLIPALIGCLEVFNS